MANFLKAQLLVYLFISLGVNVTLAQSGFPIHELGSGWYEIQSEEKIIPNSFFDDYGAYWNLNDTHELVLEKITYDEIGFSHFQFEMLHHGIPVEHAIIRLHSRNGLVEKLNGFLPNIHQPKKSPLIPAVDAIETAVKFLDAEVYAWEIEEMNQMRKELKGDPTATYYPTPELLYTDTDFKWATQNYRLAWKLEIFTIKPHGSFWVYIDAETGTVIKSLNTMQTEDVQASAVTKYSGTQTMMTDSLSDSTGTHYRLRESGRAAGGIWTLNLQNREQLSTAVDFTDSDTIWDHFNLNWDEVARDVHWGTEVTYDYFKQVNGWDSYNGQGAQVRSYVHFGPKNYSNAFWNVEYAGYGDGSGSPHVGVDIVGHEFTHGVIRNTCNLIYIDEGGALNEGHADIFGSVVEYYADSASHNWEIGEDAGPSRNMQNPKAILYPLSNTGHPDTYKGTGWFSGSGDNGGAHANCTVLGHWFYLLSEGGNGTNDLGDSYQVSGIGIEKAAQIAWRNISVYMTPTAQFKDARQGAIQAAEDLFGTCSPEAIAVINAWYAVGLGEQVVDQDIGVTQITNLAGCGLLDSNYLRLTITNFGCTDIDSNNLSLAVILDDPFTTKIEQFPIPQGITKRGSITHLFTTDFGITEPGDYLFSGEVLSTLDPNPSNNRSEKVSFNPRYPISKANINFEGPGPLTEDSLMLREGSQSFISIITGIGTQNSRGMMMEGGNGYQYRLVDAFPLWGGPPTNIFDYNPSYSSFACMCVEADSLQSLILTFDKKQTASLNLKSQFQAQFPEWILILSC